MKQKNKQKNLKNASQKTSAKLRLINYNYKLENDVTRMH